jgi:glutathione S-transferase
MSIVFYCAPFSSATPVWSALRELDVPHEQVSFDLSRGEQRSPEHLARNPNGKVPTLMIDGAPMFETLAIMHWLGEQYGVKRGLWPAAGTPERLAALSWTTWAYVELGAAMRVHIVATSERTPAELHTEALAAYARGGLEALLRVLDGHLEGRAYLLGDDYSLADLVVCSVVLYARMCGAPVEAHPRVRRWADRVAAREAIAAAWRPAA